MTAAAAPAGELPLFPLSTVLFPGGRLDLRIFEPRYLDMVRECARTGTGFGVCLIVRGVESGAPAVPAAVGTLARIEDFSTLPDGLLGIVARGGGRFRTLRTRVRDSGLVVGEVEPLAVDPGLPVPAESGVLAPILRRLAEQVGGDLGAADDARFDDAAWVAWRLAELLPLEPGERQLLLQVDDPAERLRRLAEWLPRFQRH
ncbi:MAG: LON peptidase substrate-binding domain-containing protein [Pseudomonadota bacterium]